MKSVTVCQCLQSGLVNGTLNDVQVNIAIHTITENLHIYQNPRSCYCKELMKLTTYVINSSIMLNLDCRLIKRYLRGLLPSVNVLQPGKIPWSPAVISAKHATPFSLIAIDLSVIFSLIKI